MYAWSTFQKTVNEWGRVEEWIHPGDEIAQADLGVDDDEWQGLIDNGAVREEAYPDVAQGESPADYYRANPDEAPAIDVDENTPEPEAMAAIDAGMAVGMKMPSEDAAPDEPATQAEQTAEEGSGNGGDSSGGGAPPS